MAAGGAQLMWVCSLHPRSAAAGASPLQPAAMLGLGLWEDPAVLAGDTLGAGNRGLRDVSLPIKSSGVPSLPAKLKPRESAC